MAKAKATAKTNKGEKMTLLKRAIRIGSTVGKQQGWDVFDVNSHGDVGQWAVQADDEAGLIEDDHEAIRLAREAGIDCDYYGRIRGLHDAAEPAEHTPCYRIVRYDDGPSCPIAALVVDDAGAVVATIARESSATPEYFARAMLALDPTFGEDEGGGGHPGDYPRQ